MDLITKMLRSKNDDIEEPLSVLGEHDVPLQNYEDDQPSHMFLSLFEQRNEGQNMLQESPLTIIERVQDS